MTAAAWVEEPGHLGTPIFITNTHSVGTVRDAFIEWNAKRGTAEGYSGDFSLPLVTETWDGFLNDINGFHVRGEHLAQVLERERRGAVAERNVGGGTGMVAHRFKGGIGTSSRDRRRSAAHAAPWSAAARRRFGGPADIQPLTPLSHDGRSETRRLVSSKIP